MRAGGEGSDRWRADEGSTARLVRLCALYFAFYAVTGVTVKYFQGKESLGFPGMEGMEFLVYSTTGGTVICLAVVVARGWYRLRAPRVLEWGRLRVPGEYLYIVPSGLCTAVIIPTTTLMYSLPISVMVAMVMMRGSVIVISRVVDAIQIRQGILRKKVYPVEDAAVGFALAAVAVEPVLGARGGGFDFLRSPAALAILGSYVAAYAVRIYIMNYYKNTRGRGAPSDNEGFFGVEQVSAFGALLVTGALLYAAPGLFGWEPAPVRDLRAALADPHPMWPWAVLAGTSFGMVAFFSVFIFMFQGRTATFAGLVNRLTSLLAGTLATLVFAFSFGGRYPSGSDWLSLGFILVAVAFLTRAERQRAAENAAERAAAEAPVPSGAAAPVR